MREPNYFIGINYIDDNKNMEPPPAFWLQRLYDFDAELVVFPSRYRPYAYVLARRKCFSKGMQDAALEATVTQPDTKLCLQRGLVPISLIYRTGTVWSIDNIIADLKSRDLWAAGGAEKAADALEAQEAKAEAATKQKTRDDMWNRAGLAYNLYQRRTGQRVTSPGMSSERHAPTTAPSSRTVSSGLVLADR